MSSSQVQRKPTTTLAADADGYSRMMANTSGDGLIAKFPSVVEVVIGRTD